MADFRPQSQLTEGSTAGHEPNVLSVRGVILFAVALIASGGVILVILNFVMHGFSREEVGLRSHAPPRFRDETGLFPSPRLQPDPNDELVAMKGQQLAQLNSYGWIDRNRGVAHIPINRAMEILARRGLPTSKAAFVEINGVKAATIQPPSPTEREAKPNRKQETNPR